MDCGVCGNPIKKDEKCYQLRYGYIEEDGETFLPEEDVAYCHEDCLPYSVEGQRVLVKQ